MIYSPMPVFPVRPEKEKAIRERMEALGLREEDIQESFVRSRGRGGQHVNKVSTCVKLRHAPTGVEVRCEAGRSQAMNRYQARVILADKVERLIRGRESEEQKRIAKLRRQKKRRSRRAKEKVLEQKRLQAEKKVLRRKIAPEGEE
jgi:protein subunit release factor B